MSDLIDRQAAIDAASRGCFELRGVFEIVKKEIEKLPSAQPDVSEKNVGEWIKMSDADGVYYCCSKCGEELYRKWSFNRDYDLFPKKESIDKTKHCPNCGVKMEK